MKIIAGCSSADLTHTVCKILNLEPIVPAYKRFSDGEISVTLTEPLVDETCLLIHSLSDPVNDYMIALLLTIDALKRTSARKIIICLPYLAYTRQDHSMSLIISLMHTAGAHHCITIDPHSYIEDTPHPMSSREGDRRRGDLIYSEIAGTSASLHPSPKGFGLAQRNDEIKYRIGDVADNATIPIDVLSTTGLFADHIKASHRLDNLIIIAPDQGGVERCRHVHSALGLASELIVIDKIRANGICTAQAIHGDVRGKRCIIMDDIIDTGMTLCSAAKALIERGAAEVFAYCTHGVLSGDAPERVQQSPIRKLVITDTIAPKPNTLTPPKIEVISTARLLSQQIKLLL